MPNGLTHGWTEQEVLLLGVYWRDGESMTAIAYLLRRSREAVAGKIHRLGLKLSEAERYRRKVAGPAMHRKKKP